MITRIQKWGNSQGLRFNKEILEQAHLSVGDDVEVVVQDETITVKSVNKKKRYKLDELISKIPDDYKVSEENWGDPVGKEVC